MGGRGGEEGCGIEGEAGVGEWEGKLIDEKQRPAGNRDLPRN